MFTFGIDGTLAWTTPAGELLQVASCLDNKLIAVEYKRSIDRGQGYFDRGKMLERALDQPQGSGFGIGLSLDPALEPLDKSWLYNRWPRYHFMHEGLDIRLQYYIDHHSIIQQYSVRNNGEEEKLLSYTFSSDLVFREHRGSASRIHLVPRDKTPERLFLFGNSEVLIQNQAEKCQVVMALFQNGQRQSLWSGKSQGSHDDGDASSLISSDSAADYDENEIQEVEARMRRTILHGQLADDSADAEFKSFYSRYNEDNDSPKQPRLQDHLDYSSSDIKLIVPGRSTQELRAVIQINKLPQSGVDVLTQDRKSIDNIGDLKTAAKDPRSDIRRIRARQRNVVAKAQLFSAKPPALKKWPTWKLIDDHLELGKACALAKLLGEARYHMLTACLIAEYTCGAASIKATDTQFQYAKFLNKYGWSSVGLKKMEQLSHDLSTRVSKNGQISMLKEKIRLRLAALYLEQGNFPGAEDMYIKAFGDQVGHPGNIDLTPSAAHCLERAAWAQIRQENYTAARSNYLLLLDLIPSQREVILINLGFVEMRLDNTEQARWRYETALLPDTGMREYYAKELHAQSGLFACLLKTGVDVEGNLEVAASRVRYVDVFTPLFRSTQSKLPIDEGAFHFAMTRQLETLLTACSIPVTNDNGDAGVAFVDADPLGCLFEGRAA